MDRISLECTKCRSKDFEVEISCLPTAVTLSCNKCGCATPLLVLAEGDSGHPDILAINGKAARNLYEDAFCGSVTTAMIRRAYDEDLLNKKYDENTNR